MKSFSELADQLALQMGIVCLQPDGAVTYCDDVVFQWLGKKQHELEPVDLIPLLGNHKLPSLLARVEGPTCWKVTISEISLLVSLRKMTVDDAVSPICLIVRGLAPLIEIKETFEEMKAAKEELDAIFESSYDGIYITNADGITIRTNDAIERLTGIPKVYWVSKDMRYLEKRGMVQKSVSLEVMKQKKPVTVIQENALGKVLMITGSPVFDKNGEVVRVITNLRDISELNKLREELSQLRKLYFGEDPFVVASKSMERVIELATRVAGTDTTVLLLGESGVGKEVIARLVHRNSNRYEKGAFIKVNCGAIPQELLESELFGYESGAFTGAKKDGKPGMFEMAHKGTLFLDEIGEMPLHLQVKLLRVLQDQEIRRVGGVKSIKVDVRIVAATNRNLKEMVSGGTFREDLYYRLYVVPVEIPPLRKRKEEVLPLLEFYLDRLNRKYHSAKTLHPNTLVILERYEWPGNIRELANLVERLIVICPHDEILPEHLPELSSLLAAPSQFAAVGDALHLHSLDEAEHIGLQASVELIEKELITMAFERFQSSYEVARALKISQSTAIRKAHKYGVRIKEDQEK